MLLPPMPFILLVSTILMIISKTDAACGLPPKIIGIYTVSRDVEQSPVGTEITYSCSTGYFLREGTISATCVTKNGADLWEGPTLKCSPRSCPNPGNIEHGRVIGTLYTFGQNITYECDPGYEPINRYLHRYCLANGQWSGLDPKCKPVECPEPVDPEKGKAIFTEYTYGKTVRFKCDTPLVIKGSSTRTCTEDKTWSGTQPTCEEVKCKTPDPILGGQVIVNSNDIGGTTYFLCDVLNTEVVSICQDDGYWFPKAPVCQETPSSTEAPSTTGSSSTNKIPSSTLQTPVTAGTSGEMCGLPPAIENAYHDHSKLEKEFSSNTLLTYECNKGCRMKSLGEQDQQALCTKVNKEMVWVGPTLTCSECNLIYIIVGTVFGGLILGIVVVILICWLKKRKDTSVVFVASGKTKQEKTINNEEVMNLNDRT